MPREKEKMRAHNRRLYLVGKTPPAGTADIELAVSASLANDGDIDATYIFVSARGPDITLAGWVPQNTQIDLASTVAQATHGVRRVFNELHRSL
jgi:osmotically-inducible protein OsmY